MARPPQHAIEGPPGPSASEALCALRVKVWRDLVSLEHWRAFCDRPMATAMQVLPKENVVVAESAWHEKEEKGRTIAVSGF
eukprot:13978311-Alexandrium_andersonii.AAC.1